MAGGCSSCAQRAQARAAVQNALAANQPSRPKAMYVVTAPDGTSAEFKPSDYGGSTSGAYAAAVVYKRQVNGTLTTSTE